MHTFFVKNVNILEMFKQFTEKLVNEFVNIPRRGLVPYISDLEVVELSLAVEVESIHSEK